MSKKIIISVVAALTLAIGGYVGFTQYEQYKFIEAIRPHVKNASLRLANAARYETEKNTKITFKELFEKLESDTGEIDKRILDVQTIATPSNKKVVDPVVDYLKGSQELLRALLLKSRKLLAVSNASDWSDRAIQDLRTSGYYGYEYAKRASDNALRDLRKASDEYDGSVIDVATAARNMKTAHAKVAAIFPSDVLADPTIFDAIEKKNTAESKSLEAASAKK